MISLNLKNKWTKSVVFCMDQESVAAFDGEGMFPIIL